MIQKVYFYYRCSPCLTHFNTPRRRDENTTHRSYIWTAEKKIWRRDWSLQLYTQLKQLWNWRLKEINTRSKSDTKAIPSWAHRKSDMFVCLTTGNPSFRRRNVYRLIRKWSRSITGEMDILQLSLHNHFFIRVRPPYVGGIWRRRFYSENALNFFPLHTSPEELKNPKITGYFEVIFKENSVREMTRFL